MAKRGPTSELNHDNWNQEGKSQEAGTYKRTDLDTLQSREIAQAKRRSITTAFSGSDSPNRMNTFSSFAGFKPPTNAQSPSFSFLSQKSADNSEPKEMGVAKNETLDRETANCRKTSKRGPTSDLNHENWNQEEKPEEAGTFTRADPNILKTREIKQAKRRSISSPYSGSSPNRMNAFSSFAGFKPPVTTSSPSFSFLSQKSEDKNESIGKENESNKYAGRPNEFYADLRSLNESVSKWIKSHVDDNPCCVLSPVFKDYEKHLASLDKIYPKKEHKSSPRAESKMTNETIAETTPSLNINTTVNNSDKDSTETKAPSVKPAFSFNFSKDCNDSDKDTNKLKTNMFASVTSSPAANITFGLNKDSNNSVFSSGKPFTFSNVSKPNATSSTESEENEEPPKVEFTPVVEEDSLYSIRCKVFVKKGGTYQDRGVGTMYLKPVVNSSKVQLIVRADTSLGNLILNTLLPCAVPAKKMGNNNVMLACIPTPDTEPPPVPVLLRVKTSEDADTMLEKINSCAK